MSVMAVYSPLDSAAAAVPSDLWGAVKASQCGHSYLFHFYTQKELSGGSLTWILGFLGGLVNRRCASSCVSLLEFVSDNLLLHAERRNLKARQP